MELLRGLLEPAQRSKKNFPVGICASIFSALLDMGNWGIGLAIGLLLGFWGIAAGSGTDAVEFECTDLFGGNGCNCGTDAWMFGCSGGDGGNCSSSSTVDEPASSETSGELRMVSKPCLPWARPP